MSDHDYTGSEAIITNKEGGKQSKIYVAYDAIDPWVLHALAAVHHRGLIKYERDNWRRISTQDHINHAMHHLVETNKRLTWENLPAELPTARNFNQHEDELAHALCRVAFALAMEIKKHGLHGEHFDPTYHEPKTPPVEPESLRGVVDRLGSVPPTPYIDTGTRRSPAPNGAPRRNDLVRPSKVKSRTRNRSRKSPVHRSRRRR